MLALLETRWPFISLLFLLALLIALIFSPSSTGALAIAMLCLSLGMTIIFTINKQVQAHHENKIDHATLTRNIFIEVTGILLTMGLAIFLAPRAVGMVGSMAKGWMGIVIAIVLSMLVGLGVGWLVKVTWGRLIKA